MSTVPLGCTLVKKLPCFACGTCLRSRRALVPMIAALQQSVDSYRPRAPWGRARSAASTPSSPPHPRVSRFVDSAVDAVEGEVLGDLGATTRLHVLAERGAAALAASDRFGSDVPSPRGASVVELGADVDVEEAAGARAAVHLSRRGVNNATCFVVARRVTAGRQLSGRTQCPMMRVTSGASCLPSSERTWCNDRCEAQV